MFDYKIAVWNMAKISLHVLKLFLGLKLLCVQKVNFKANLYAQNKLN